VGRDLISAISSSPPEPERRVQGWARGA